MNHSFLEFAVLVRTRRGWLLPRRAAFLACRSMIIPATVGERFLRSTEEEEEEENDARSTKEEEEEVALRRTLVEKPRNARAMAQLAVWLDRKVKKASSQPQFTQQERFPPVAFGTWESSSKSDAPNLTQRTYNNGGKTGSAHRSDEAMQLARRAVEVRPDKPFGYWALSILLTEHNERMSALREAAQRSLGVPHALALCRLLLEPRYEETVRVRGDVGTASANHPSRRALNRKEEELYDELETSLSHLVDDADGSATTGTQQQHVELALRDYALGHLFRKMRPLELYQSRTLHHLQRAYRKLPESHPQKSLAAFWLTTRADASAQWSSTITKCPPNYVTGLYSTFAERFDDCLVVKLAYQTPMLLRQLWDDTRGLTPSPSILKRGLDLGCGTGLSGQAFRDCVQHLVGVDMSPEMLDRAAGRQCYNRLLLGDVTEAIQLDNRELFELVFACDVLVYIGDMLAVFEHVSNIVNKGGWWAFSTEVLEATDNCDPPNDFRLLPTGRFAHSEQYISKLALQTGFHVRATKVCPIRKNEGVDIIGHLAILVKS